MATISTEKTGRRTIYVQGNDGRRRPIRLGKCSLRQAQTVLLFVEDLARAAHNGASASEKTTVWLGSIGDNLRDKLARAGLVQRRETVKLGPFMDAHIKRRAGAIKQTTVVRLKQARQHMVDFFGDERSLSTINAGDAVDYRDWLLGTKNMAEATTRRNCGYASMWLTYAVKHDLIKRNPFEDVPTAAVGNASRQAYICEDDALAVLSQLPNSNWRLLFALARWGGLRTPSEARAMVWADVDWEHHRLTVRSPKTEHHQGHDKRIIPLFPEIEGPLHGAFEQAAEGTLYVLPFLRNRTAAALRKPLEKAIEAAGLSVWPRLWHNLRASRQTELEGRFPSHIVCCWLGNSERVARQHYLQVRDTDFDKAIEKVVRNPVRAIAIDPANARYEDDGKPRKPRKNTSIRQETPTPAFAGVDSMGEVGFEPT